MPVRILCVFAIAGLIFVMEPLWGHHSVAAQYDVSKSITVTGTVTKVEWKNPHVFFYISLKDATGKVIDWELELGSTSGLLRRGWTRNSLKPGDSVTVNGYPARDGSNLANALAVTLSNGRKVFAGSAEEAPAR